MFQASLKEFFHFLWIRFQKSGLQKKSERKPHNLRKGSSESLLLYTKDWVCPGVTKVKRLQTALADKQFCVIMGANLLRYFEMCTLSLFPISQGPISRLRSSTDSQILDVMQEYSKIGKDSFCLRVSGVCIKSIASLVVQFTCC